MTGWHSKTLGDGVEAFVPRDKIQDAWYSLALAQASGGHNSYNSAVFSEFNPRANVVTIYFSPAAEPLAKMFGAIPCEKPIPAGNFGLEVGDDRAWEIHFPGYLEKRKSDRMGGNIPE